MTTCERGKWGEDIAVKFLHDRSYVVLDRNWHCRYGELDIVVVHKDRPNVLIIVEVKLRSSSKFGEPYEAITWQKRQALWATTKSYLTVKGNIPWIWQLDIIAIHLALNRLSHYKNVLNM